MKSYMCALAVSLITFAASQASAASAGSESEAATGTVTTDTYENIAEPHAGDGWHFGVTPYLWVAGISGDIELAEGEEVDIDTDFSDILSDLKFAAMVAFEARSHRFVVLGDVIYLSVGTETAGPAGFLEAKVDPRVFIGTLAAGYRVLDRGPLFIDLFAGGRLASLKIDVKLDGPQQSVERSRSKSSLAPVVGARVRVPLGDRWGFAVYGDMGGFGASADMSWQLMSTVQYDLSNHWRFAAGYRHVAIKHDKHDFDVDLALSGPILGFSYRFH